MSKKLFRSGKDMMKVLPQKLGEAAAASAGGLGAGYLMNTALPKWTKEVDKLDASGNPVKDANGNIEKVKVPMIPKGLSAAGITALSILGKVVIENDYADSLFDGMTAMGWVQMAGEYDFFGENSSKNFGLLERSTATAKKDDGVKGVGSSSEVIDWDAVAAQQMQNVLPENNYNAPEYAPAYDTPVNGVEEENKF